MTTIQDMTPTQRHSWLVLLADGAVFAWFWQKMIVGRPPVPINYDMRELGEIVLGVIMLTIALHVVISIVLKLWSRTTTVVVMSVTLISNIAVLTGDIESSKSD